MSFMLIPIFSTRWASSIITKLESPMYDRNSMADFSVKELTTTGSSQLYISKTPVFTYSNR